MATAAEINAELERRGLITREQLIDDEMARRGLSLAPKVQLDPVSELPREVIEPPESTETALNPVVAETASAVNRGAAAAKRSESKGILHRPMFPMIAEAITGSTRKTELTESLPELQMSGLFAGEDSVRVALVTPALMTATDPNEIVDIVTSNFPNIGVTFNQDGQGDVFPILVNNKNGGASAINSPGLSGFDMLRTAALASAFFPTTKGASALAAGAKALAVSSTIQGVQEASGGEFNPIEVGTDTLLGVGGKVLEKIVSAGGRIVAGSSVDDIVKTADDLGIPILTSDVRPPATFIGKQAQRLGERIPLAGTASTRATQQTARQQAVDEVISKYGEFSYDAIVQSS